jgi:SAM-dependent methyltransferase
MSDGPSKAVPGGGRPLDDIILGEDEPRTDPPPPPVARPSSPPPVVARSSQRPGAYGSSPPPADGSRPNFAPPPAPPSGYETPPGAPGNERASSNRMKRAKMTLRIPDDEVTRPHRLTPSGMPAAPVLDPPANRQPTEPDAHPGPQFVATGPPPAFGVDDTLEMPPDNGRQVAAAAAAIAPVATGIDPSHEPGWTPFSPAVDDDEERTIIQPVAPAMADEGAQAHGAHGQDFQNGGGSVLDAYSPPPSDEIPVEIADVPETPSDEITTSPRLPNAYDSEEIRIEEGERVSETGEIEVAVEDVMSVESLPVPAPPLKSAGKFAAYKLSDPPTPSPSSPDLEVSPPARTSSPDLSRQRPLTDLDPTPPTNPVITAAASTNPLRRSPSNPLLIVPPASALAPPPMTDTAAHRKKTRPWWEELFNDDFIRTMAKVTDSQIGAEVNFIEESLGCEAGAMILDLACGTGRHAVELAARGYQVVGFDLSLAMLARASDEAQDRNQKINFVQGDMREMTFEETFDGIYSWNTSFGYFDEEKNGAVIARVHKALKKGGQFLLDVVNRDYIIRQAPSLAWFEGDGCICMDEMGIDFITSRMKVKRTLMMDDGRTKEIEYSIRIYGLHELGKMLHDNGFRVAEVSGRTSTPGVFFGCESPRTLILAEKR